MKTEDQLVEWIVARVISFSPSYFESQRIIFVGFLGPDTIFEFDGVQMHASNEASLKSKLSRVKKGKERLVFIATMIGNSSFRLRSMGPRGSGAGSLNTFEVVDGDLVIEQESSILFA